MYFVNFLENTIKEKSPANPFIARTKKKHRKRHEIKYYDYCKLNFTSCTYTWLFYLT